MVWWIHGAARKSCSGNMEAHADLAKDPLLEGWPRSWYRPRFSWRNQNCHPNVKDFASSRMAEVLSMNNRLRSKRPVMTMP